LIYLPLDRQKITTCGDFRLVRATYFTFTTNPADINKIDDLVASGKTLPEAIDYLAQTDYKRMWGEELKAVDTP